MAYNLISYSVYNTIMTISITETRMGGGGAIFLTCRGSMIPNCRRPMITTSLLEGGPELLFPPTCGEGGGGGSAVPISP